MKWKVIAIAALVSLLGCSEEPPPPRLLVVASAAQLDGNLGMYWAETVYLAPGATWEVLQHELDHHRYGSMGESGWNLTGPE